MAAFDGVDRGGRPTLDPAEAATPPPPPPRASLPSATRQQQRYSPEDPVSLEEAGHHRPNRRLSPGLRLRLLRLEEQKRRKLPLTHQAQYIVGRIPEEQLRELERHQREGREGFELVGQEKTRDRSGHPLRVDMPSGGGVRLSGGPVLTDTETSVLDTDVSSIITIDDRLVLSDSEDEQFKDTHKYRLPDPGKTRLHLHTKEPLSPTSRQVATASRMVDKELPMTPTGRPSSGPNASSTSLERSPWSPPQFRRNDDGADHINASDSDFVGSGLSRSGSIYTLSRATFEGQLSKLTSMRLPDANSLAKRIASLPSAAEAAKALSDASDQIRRWINKAGEVLNGLNAEDDVEWAAAGGRDGLEDVDQAVNRFERLVQVYILSIERFHTRPDLESVSAEQLNSTVLQMDKVISSWSRVTDTLKGIKEQVEVALEWEELWNSVLGEIGQELEGLERLVFEMEEKRHSGANSILALDKHGHIDLNELETIVEKQPDGQVSKKNRLTLLQPFSPKLPLQPIDRPADVGIKEENSSETYLLALFARMQPLRASLDFLPMRLSSFQIRASAMFPTACQDLESRREHLERAWKKLEVDSESLRRELGEDRWVLVFRNAGRQALKMLESVGRSYHKLRMALENGEQAGNKASLTKKVDSYEAKKTHYGPAIERVLAIVDRGVMDRLTVNGEILRLQSDMKQRWATLQADMKEVDSHLEDLAAQEMAERQMRDSVSTVMSTEAARSMASSILGGSADTPGSSPPSSVINGGSSRKNSTHGSRTPTPLVNTKLRKRQGSITSSTSKASTATEKLSSVGTASRGASRGSLTASSSTHMTRSPNATPSPATNQSDRSVGKHSWPSREPLRQDPSKPKWSSSIKAANRDFRPLSASEPSPYAKSAMQKRTYAPRTSSISAVACTLREQSSRASLKGDRNVSAPSPMPSSSSTKIPASAIGPRKSSLPVKVPSTPSAITVTPVAGPSNLHHTIPRPSSRLTSGRRSVEPVDGNDADTESPLTSRSTSRPLSSLGGRRSSMLPMRLPVDASSTKRTQPVATDAVGGVGGGGGGGGGGGAGGAGGGGGGAGGGAAAATTAASGAGKAAIRRTSMLPIRPASKLDVEKAMAAAAEEERPRWQQG